MLISRYGYVESTKINKIFKPSAGLTYVFNGCLFQWVKKPENSVVGFPFRRMTRMMDKVGCFGF